MATKRWLVYPSGSEPLDFYTTQAAAESAASALALADRGTTFLIDRAVLDTESTLGTAETTVITPDPLAPDLVWIRFNGTDVDEITSWTPTWNVGAPSFVTGVYNQAVKVDTTNYQMDYLAKTPAVLGDDVADISVFLWHKATVASNFVTIFRWDGVGGGGGNSWGIQINSDGLALATVYDSGAGAKQSNVSYGGFGEWIFFGFTWVESTETGIVYRGFGGESPLVTGTMTGSFTGPRNTGVTMTDLSVAESSPANDEGYIDEFRYYGSALTAAQVNTLYVSGKSALGL